MLVVTLAISLLETLLDCALVIVLPLLAISLDNNLTVKVRKSTCASCRV